MGSYVPSSVYSQPTHTPTIFRFDDLVYDIQTYIISYFLSVPDLVSLTLVSRYIHSLATPALYTDAKFLLGWKHSSNNASADGAFTKTLLNAQRAFKTELLAHPDRARHIRNLTWQFSSGHAFTDLFPLLYNLTAIHVVDAHPTDIRELHHNVNTLFPRIKTLKFTGITCLTFAMPMLHTPQRITALSLDTIEPHTAHVHLLHWISIADLSNLSTLALRAQSQSDPIRKTEILVGWKDALLAVRNTVTDITLGVTERWSTPGASASASALSTECFAQPLLPVFWEQSWPRLKRLRLEGIELDMEDAARLERVVPELDVDSTVQVVRRVWDEKALQNF